MKYLMCNLKNKLVKEEIISYIQKIKDIKMAKTKLVFFPSFLWLSSFETGNYELGCQDISSFSEKTITGEVMGSQLESLGASYVLVGHSERRIYKNEINIDFINKINHAQEHNLKVVYCIGESLEDHDKGDTYNVLEKQISEVLNNVNLKDIIIAYEPIFAIGTGLTPKTVEIEDTIQFIKDIIDEKYEIPIKVLYGGSVNGDNIEVLNKISNVDGFLVGGSSLNPENVQKMLSVMDD